MNVRQSKERHNSAEHRLEGWKLVAALVVIAAATIATLWLTQSVEAVIIVVAPLLLVVGAKASGAGDNST